MAGTYICGRSPSESEEPPVTDLSVDHEYFDEKIWPELANRVKSFDKLKVRLNFTHFFLRFLKHDKTFGKPCMLVGILYF